MATIHGNSPNWASLLVSPVMRKPTPSALRWPQQVVGCGFGVIGSIDLLGFWQHTSR
jgi:hypothetical protein